MFGPYADIPKSGFTGNGGASGYNAIKAKDSTFNVVSTSDYATKYALGTIIPYWNATIGGYGACVYLQAKEALTIGLVVTNLATSHTSAQITLSGGMAIGCTPAAVALGTVTDEYYAWFWCKGVCPDMYTSASAKISAATISIISGVTLTAGETFFAATAGEIDEYLETDVAIPAGHAISSGSGAGGTIAFGEVKLIGSGWGF